MPYTKGERKFIDKTAGGIVFAGLFPYAVQVNGRTLGTFVNKEDALLDAAAPIGDELANAILDSNFEDYDWIAINDIAKKFKDKSGG